MSTVDPEELARYLQIYQDHPDSRVFAPLADLYRRLGRFEEAHEILESGLKRHPYYLGGRVALAHLYLDQNRNLEAAKDAQSVVQYYPENLLARKILITAWAKLGKKSEAEKEWLMLKDLAPAVAADPELEALIQGEVETFKMIHEKTQVPQAQNLESKLELPREFQGMAQRWRLLRKKRILELLKHRVSVFRSQ